MGIRGIEHELCVIPCEHIKNARAIFIEIPDGSKPVDLVWENFPANGRCLLMNQTVAVTCATCRDNIHSLLFDFYKKLSQQSLSYD
jgi:hypothetical protein